MAIEMPQIPSLFGPIAMMIARSWKSKSGMEMVVLYACVCYMSNVYKCTIVVVGGIVSENLIN